MLCLHFMKYFLTYLICVSNPGHRRPRSSSLKCGASLEIIKQFQQDLDQEMLHLPIGIH